MATLGKNIALLLKEAGLTQEELARKANIDKGNLSLLIRDKIWVSRETIQKIASALKVSLGVLFAETGDEFLGIHGYSRVPIVATAHEVPWKDCDPRPAPSDRYQSVLVEMRNAGQAFAMRMVDDSMLPDFWKDDTLVINPSGKPRPGKFVAADSEESGLVFRQYRETVVRKLGDPPAFELHPLNPSYPVLRSADLNLRILGLLVEVRRKVV